MYKQILLGFLLLFLSSGAFYAQNETETAVSLTEVEGLEERLRGMENRLEKQEMFQANQSKELELKFEALALEGKNNLFWNLGKILGGIILILGGFIVLKNKLTSETENRLKKALSELETQNNQALEDFNTNWQTILEEHLKVHAPKLLQETTADLVKAEVRSHRKEVVQLLKRERNQTTLKSQSKLLVLSESAEKRESMQNLLEILGFKMTGFATPETFKDEEIGEYDLVIFDQETDKLANQFFFNQQKMLEIIGKNWQNQLFLYFGPWREYLKTTRGLNFANSRFTLHNRLLDLLMFREVYSKIQKSESAPTPSEHNPKN